MKDRIDGAVLMYQIYWASGYSAPRCALAGIRGFSIGLRHIQKTARKALRSTIRRHQRKVVLNIEKNNALLQRMRKLK